MHCSVVIPTSTVTVEVACTTVFILNGFDRRNLTVNIILF